MPTPALMAALLSGQLGNNPAGSQMLDSVRQTMTGGPPVPTMGLPPPGGMPPPGGPPPEMPPPPMPPGAGPGGPGGLDVLSMLGLPVDQQEKRLYGIAGIGLGKILDNIPKIANSMMDLMSAKKESESPPGALPTPGEPPTEGGPPGMPPGPMEGPPPQGGPPPQQAPPPALMALMMRMLAARQAAQGAQLPGMPPPPGMLG